MHEIIVEIVEKLKIDMDGIVWIAGD